MRFVTYLQGREARPGVLQDDHIVDISAVVPSVHAVVSGGEDTMAIVKKAVEGIPAKSGLPLKEVTLCSPLVEARRNLYCVGWNYMKHFEEGVGRRQELEQELPKFPTYFSKATGAVNGPYATVSYDPEFSDNLDYEGELAVVIGRQGGDIPESEALDYVFGYMVANDISARDVQRKHGGQWFKGKSMDGSAPMGPTLVTKDEIPDVQDLTVQTTYNGQVVQESSTKAMIFTIAHLIADLSRSLTLVPGDILLTGTPDGVGWMRKPPIFLRDGDTVEVEISGLGRISNRMVKRT